MKRKDYRQIAIVLLISLMISLGTAVRNPVLGAIFAGAMLSAVLAVYFVIRLRGEGEEP